MPSKRLQGAIDILREHGPLTVEELGPRLAAIGATTARDPVKAALQAVEREERFLRLTDGRWMELAAALEGASLPHRITRDERRRAALRMDPDLSVLGRAVGVHERWWSPPPLLYAHIVVGWVRDRRLDRRHAAPDRYLAIPYDLARSMQPGDMVRVRVTNGTLLVEPDPVWQDPDPVEHPEVEAAARRLLRSGRSDHPADPVRIDELLLEAVGDAPDLLRRLRAPVGTLLRHHDLVPHRDLVGTPSTDWSEHDDGAAVWTMVRRLVWEQEDRTREHERLAALDLWDDPADHDDWLDDDDTDLLEPRLESIGGAFAAG